MAKYRYLDGDPMPKKVRKDFQRRGLRVYSTDCGYTMSHTKHFCGRENCPEG